MARIYTKTGDTGKTALIGGTRVPKYDKRIEAYGTVDELKSWVGLIRDKIDDNHQKEVLIEIQDRLFTIESLLAQDGSDTSQLLPKLKASDIEFLENQIDLMNESLPPIKSFVLPGGHELISITHITRTVCRRAERIIIELNDLHQVESLIIKYMNRLSDYFFVLARKLTSDLNAEETVWKPRI
jgi:cob(I)alamin adenosyltransferase